MFVAIQGDLRHRGYNPFWIDWLIEKQTDKTGVMSENGRQLQQNGWGYCTASEEGSSIHHKQFLNVQPLAERAMCVFKITGTSTCSEGSFSVKHAKPRALLLRMDGQIKCITICNTLLMKMTSQGEERTVTYSHTYIRGKNKIHINYPKIQHSLPCPLPLQLLKYSLLNTVHTPV